MLIRQAEEKDVLDIKDLYFNFLTKYPPKEEQNIEAWKKLINEFNKNDRLYLLVIEEDNRVVSTVQLAIIPSLTHNMRSFAVVENVVTHRESTLNFYKENGFEIDTKHSFLKKL